MKTTSENAPALDAIRSKIRRAEHRRLIEFIRLGELQLDGKVDGLGYSHRNGANAKEFLDKSQSFAPKRFLITNATTRVTS
jgi:hypothetical protein